jgi:uncharacterized protein YndB with AHSA1/START domain
MSDDNTFKGTHTRDLVFARIFDAPVERVWRAWSAPEHVKL